RWHNLTADGAPDESCIPQLSQTLRAMAPFFALAILTPYAFRNRSTLGPHSRAAMSLGGPRVRHSITSSAPTMMEGGNIRPSARAAFLPERRQGRHDLRASA